MRAEIPDPPIPGAFMPDAPMPDPAPMPGRAIPGLFPPVLIHVEGEGGSYDEMHVDGGTTQSFFVTSQIAQQEKKHFQVLDRAQVFVLVNGQLSTYPQTTRQRPVSRPPARHFGGGY